MENWTGNELFRPAVSGEQRLRARSPFALTNMASIRVKHKDANGKPIILDDAGSMLAPCSSSGEDLARGASEAVVRVVQRDHLGRSAAVGRRKEASAQVFIRKGSGEFIVNRVPFTEYFLSWEERMQFVVPFQVTDTLGAFDVWTLVQGGGKKGQAEAIRLGIARALQKFDPQYRKALKKNLLLRRDPRVVERQKPGQKGARKKFQWVKR
jgi:small subunit ribosomal protein S9